MSKAPHPHSPPLRLVGADRPIIDRIRENWPELKIVRVQGKPADEPTPFSVRDFTLDDAGNVAPAVPCVDCTWMVAIGGKCGRCGVRAPTWDEYHLINARREDAQARLRFTRSWPRAAWAWMWGE